MQQHVKDQFGQIESQAISRDSGSGEQQCRHSSRALPGGERMNNAEHLGERRIVRSE